MEDYDIKMLAEQPWEDTIDFLTRDMDTHDIDVKVLAERYQEYINELQDYNLSVPARAIRVCAALLNMKAMIALDYEDEQEQEEPENPMDFEEVEFMDEDEIQDTDQPDLETGPDLQMPVKPRPRRRMAKSELKDALKDAMEVKEKREQRQEERQQMDEQFEFEEETIQDKVNSLYNNLKSMVTPSEKQKVHFNKLLNQQTKEEKLEKFTHVLHLENDKKVQCIQDEFLGDLHVKPEEKPENQA